MVLVSDIRLRRVLDSRGDPTVEADVLTDHGGFGRAAAPSGASTGEHEAVERPPREAIAAARERAVPRLINEVHVGDQRAVDAALRAADGTDAFAEIGANSAVAISMAAAKAAADVLGVPLYQHLGGAFQGSTSPVPLGNVVGGGEHAADGPDIQEVLVAPVGAPNVTDAVMANAAVHARVDELLADRGAACGMGDEGAWAPAVGDREAIELVETAAADVSDEVGFDIRLGLDVAATELYDDGTYRYGRSGTDRTTEEQIAYIAELIETHNLVYVEDPLHEDDFEGTARLTNRVDDGVLICGDDLFVTNVERLQRGIDAGAASSVLVKPNQIGTLSDAVDTIERAQRNGYEAVVSHRSGETTDATIAHLAVASGAGYIKTGAVGGERTAKLNELIRIEDDAI
ncbi:MAG: phosphopyruvate hydratase [Salinarchaeum sp.]